MAKLGGPSAVELGPGVAITPNIHLVRPLGRGGMGSVWVARHRALDVEVAVKFVSPELLKNHPDVAERFVREARAAARIRDPHVVHVLDQGLTADGTPFIAMELLEGMSLGAQIARWGPLSLTAVATIVAQIAGALGKAHKLGVIHRDIKPENLFLTTTGGSVFVKVLDFGIAKQLHAEALPGLTTTGAVFGTPPYMSPEQLLDSKGVDAQADLWALAVVAHEALTGRLPFSGATQAALILAICNTAFKPPSTLDPDLPASVDAWFARALTREPTQRFASAQIFARSFADACAGKAPTPPHEVTAEPPAVSAPPAPALPVDSASATPEGPATMSGATSTLTLVPRRDRERRKWLAAGALVASVAVAAVWWAWRQRPPARMAPVAASSPAPVATASGPEVFPASPEASDTGSASVQEDPPVKPSSPIARPGRPSAPDRPAAAPTTAAPDAGAPRAPSPSATPEPDCSDPFWIDAQGIKRVRKECR